MDEKDFLKAVELRGRSVQLLSLPYLTLSLGRAGVVLLG